MLPKTERKKHSDEEERHKSVLGEREIEREREREQKQHTINFPCFQVQHETAHQNSSPRANDRPRKG